MKFIYSSGSSKGFGSEVAHLEFPMKFIYSSWSSKVMQFEKVRTWDLVVRINQVAQKKKIVKFDPIQKKKIKYTRNAVDVHVKIQTDFTVLEVTKQSCMLVSKSTKSILFHFMFKVPIQRKNNSRHNSF